MTTQQRHITALLLQVAGALMRDGQGHQGPQLNAVLLVGVERVWFFLKKHEDHAHNDILHPASNAEDSSS